MLLLFWNCCVIFSW